MIAFEHLLAAIDYVTDASDDYLKVGIPIECFAGTVDYVTDAFDDYWKVGIPIECFAGAIGYWTDNRHYCHVIASSAGCFVTEIDYADSDYDKADWLAAATVVKNWFVIDQHDIERYIHFVRCGAEYGCAKNLCCQNVFADVVYFDQLE